MPPRPQLKPLRAQIQTTLEAKKRSPCNRSALSTPCRTRRPPPPSSLSTWRIRGLPGLRSHVAAKLAEKAIALVLDGLPDRMNPAQWSARAHELAMEQLGDPPGSSSSVGPQHGCRGLLLLVGPSDSGDDWILMYYDADEDAAYRRRWAG